MAGAGATHSLFACQLHFLAIQCNPTTTPVPCAQCTSGGQLLHAPLSMHSVHSVRRACRRQGVARELLRASERLAAWWGHGSIWLHVEASNVAGVELYRQAG